jgi:hypothetical protein
MEKTLRQSQSAIVIEKIGVREIACEHRIVVAQSRAQQFWLCPFYREMEVRQISRIAMIEAIGVAGPGDSIAIMIEDRECIVVLECPGTPFLQRYRGGAMQFRVLHRVASFGSAIPIIYGLIRSKIIVI